MADDNEYSSMKRERSRSPLDDDSRDRDGDNDHDGDRDRGRRLDRGRRMDRPRGGGRRGSEDTRIYVSNIPYEYKWQDLKDLFRKEVGEVAYVEMFNDENNRPRGCAVIEFENSDLVAKAVKIMHRFELKGRKLVVKEKADDLPLAYLSQARMGNRMGGPSRQDFDSDRDRRMMKSDMRSRDFGRGGGGDIGGPPSMGSVNKFGNTYGLSTVFLESLGITGTLVNKVFVANLDYKVDDKMLRDVFKIAGKVVGVEISKDQDGKSRGFGVVEFEHPVEAVQAISMFHNQTYYDRKMSVRMDRVTEKQESATTKLPPGLKSVGMGLGVNGSALTDVASLPNAVATGVSALPGVGSLASNMGTLGNQNMGMMGMGNTGGMGTGLANIGTGMSNMGSSMGNMGTGMGNLGNIGSGMGNMSAGMNAMGNGMGSSMMGGMGGSGMGTSSSMVSGLTGGMGTGLAGSGGLVGSSMSRGSLGSGGGGGGYSSYSSSSLSRDYNHASGATNSSSSSYTGGYRNIIQLSNLPLDYTWQSLRDLCREFGDIRFAEIRSKGIGTVRFQTEADARRAVEMLDRQRLDGRILDVILL